MIFYVDLRCVSEPQFKYRVTWLSCRTYAIRDSGFTAEWTPQHGLWVVMSIVLGKCFQLDSNFMSACARNVLTHRDPIPEPQRHIRCTRCSRRTLNTTTHKKKRRTSSRIENIQYIGLNPIYCMQYVHSSVVYLPSITLPRH